MSLAWRRFIPTGTMAATSRSCDRRPGGDHPGKAETARLGMNATLFGEIGRSSNAALGDSQLRLAVADLDSGYLTASRETQAYGVDAKSVGGA
jgi:hypothetical protein